MTYNMPEEQGDVVAALAKATDEVALGGRKYPRRAQSHDGPEISPIDSTMSSIQLDLRLWLQPMSDFASGSSSVKDTCQVHVH